MTQKKNQTNDVPVVYLYLHRKMLDKKSSHLRVSVTLEILKRTIYHMPKSLHHQVLKEMEEHNLIKKLNNRLGYMIYPIDNPLQPDLFQSF